MSDRAWATIEVVYLNPDITLDQVNRLAEIIDQAGFGSEFDDDPQLGPFGSVDEARAFFQGPGAAGPSLVEEDARLVICEETHKALAELADQVGYMLHQDPVYEYDGTIIFHLPKGILPKGDTYVGTANEAGEPYVTQSQIHQAVLDSVGDDRAILNRIIELVGGPWMTWLDIYRGRQALQPRREWGDPGHTPDM